jgi:hypothetical protein
METEEDEIYFTFAIRRSDVEAIFAETGAPALPRSVEIIGDCLKDTPVDELKRLVLDLLLGHITEATKAILKKKET